MADVLASAAEDWQYKAEGAKHIAFTYVGDRSSLKRRILRLPKHDLAENAELRHFSFRIEQEIAYAHNLMADLVGRQFVPEMKSVRLDTNMVKALARHVEDVRPAHRRNESCLDTETGVGMLMLDCSVLPFIVRNPTTNGSLEAPEICVELKPKWGYLPSSPFVQSPVKFTTCRYCMHQLLKGRITSPSSKYCPLRLFSKDRPSMIGAVVDLLNEPSNNLRVFQNGVPIYGARKRLCLSAMEFLLRTI